MDGVGEPTICVVTPSVLNAIHEATGKPVRSYFGGAAAAERVQAGAGHAAAWGFLGSSRQPPRTWFVETFAEKGLV